MLFVINVHNFFHLQQLVRNKILIEIFLFGEFLGYLIEPNPLPTNKVSANGVTLQRSNSLTSLASATGFDDKDNEDYLRICLSCKQVLQRRYDQLSFKNTEKDEVFLYYEVKFSFFSLFLYTRIFLLENR